MAILDERFDDVDRRLAWALKNARSSTTHRGVRGDELAGALGEEIQDHFIDCASFHERCEIRDTHCKLSHEVDLIFLNRFHPTFLLKNRPRVFLIEGVLAAAEVKTSLDKVETIDCLEKARTFKRLHSKLTENDYNAQKFDNPDDRDRYLVRRPFFAFAYQESSNPATERRGVGERQPRARYGTDRRDLRSQQRNRRQSWYRHRGDRNEGQEGAIFTAALCEKARLPSFRN